MTWTPNRITATLLLEKLEPTIQYAEEFYNSSRDHIEMLKCIMMHYAAGERFL